MRVMASPTPCTGVLLWFDVPAEPPRFPASALMRCTDCGYLLVAGSAPDERHADTLVLRD